MSYYLLALSLVLSVVVYRRWAALFKKLFAKRSDEGEDSADGEGIDLSDTDFADADSAVDWWGLVVLILPRQIRSIWNGAVFLCLWLLLSSPHLLVMHSIFSGQNDGRVYLDYVLSLAYWLMMLAIPALMLARHQAARLHRATRRSAARSARSIEAVG